MPRQTEVIPLLSPSPGSQRELIVHRYGEKGKGKKVYIQAALHADEWPGLMAAHHLIPLLDEADAAGDIQGEIIVVPYANPIGMAQRINGKVAGRYSFDGSGNFNRNWADLVSGAAPLLKGNLTGNVEEDVEKVRAAFREVVSHQSCRTEVDELRMILMNLSCDADFVLDLHCDGEAELHVYANQQHEDEAYALCQDLDSPVLLIETEAGGGPFDEANSSPWWRLKEVLPEASHLPPVCCAVTVEFRGLNDISDELGRKDAQGLISFLRRMDIIAGKPAPQRNEVQVSFLHATDVLHAPIGGLVSYQVELGEQVKKGDLIAVVIDIAAQNPMEGRHEVHSRANGRYFAQMSERLVRPGESIAKVAGQEILAHRAEGNLLEA
ncbi:succinylglutamate desuccinylase/aspartoacylase family protein [Curvivirga aplysinae]|uniref:succinylglutamate desuccinylase/aspartoacylase family protein n=1 Tax=Curvivirga aplysinae TaxID=2529852 RepID=UPI0012BC76F2|nr:succinylglutamate desuccinylase/aspartoacylase family protein [Curvivirga aplysinae]MTI08798.1 succinylglutamate desuccinylase/aspartoacylase family protein [Curvivirga aplysinae]